MMLRRLPLISIASSWLILPFSLSLSKDTDGKEVFFRNDKDEFIQARPDDTEPDPDFEPIGSACLNNSNIPEKLKKLVRCKTNETENITCGRFIAKYDNKTTDPPPKLNADLDSVLQAKIFEYIGTREGGKGPVYLSTKSDGDPVIVYNFDNNDKPNIGWRGNVVRTASITWKQLEGSNILFKTEFGENACKTPHIENCTEGAWSVLIGDGSGEHVPYPALFFECEILPYFTDKWISGNCTSSDPEKECGEGKRTQTKECIVGNIDDCSIFQDSENQITTPCNITCPTTDDTTGTQNPLPDSTEVISNDSEATEVTNPTNGPNGKKTEATKPDTGTTAEGDDNATRSSGRTYKAGNVLMFLLSIILSK